MLFITPEFALFFCITCLLYFSLPGRWRWLVLLVSSYVFYATWNLPYVGLLFFSTAFNYLVARAIGASTTRRGLLLFAGVTVNVLILAIFKYFNFVSDSVA